MERWWPIGEDRTPAMLVGWMILGFVVFYVLVSPWEEVTPEEMSVRYESAVESCVTRSRTAALRNGAVSVWTREDATRLCEQEFDYYWRLSIDEFRGKSDERDVR